ncbi:type II toxin-antitoxin system VapB family antitoxin [soil metagenome]|jgi:antitoxin VapB|nr:type II toxin-antitoxin system VapB family antitoxin [Deinococcota bacterium]
MALNIKNAEVERLAHEVSAMTGENKTQAIKRALEERKARLELAGGQSRAERLRRFLEEEVWPNIPEDVRGKRLSKEEEEEVLGFGPDGV